jgi:hypothetical protein
VNIPLFVSLFHFDFYEPLPIQIEVSGAPLTSDAGEEVPATVEVLIPDQPQVRLVDEGGGVEGLAGGFGGHACGGELPQLVVDERQEVGGLSVAGRGSIKEAGHIGHGARVYQLLAAEAQENEGELALPPLGGYQQLNDVSFLAARSIT